MSQYSPQKPKNIVPFDGSTKGKEPDTLDLDRSGQAIISLLQEAAQVAHTNEERATGLARKIAEQVKAAEAHAAQLEAEVQQYADRAIRAENWLLRVYKEIEDKFFQNTDQKPGQAIQR